jgi:hypothetical protein
VTVSDGPERRTIRSEGDVRAGRLAPLRSAIREIDIVVIVVCAVCDDDLQFRHARLPFYSVYLGTL